MTARPLKSFKKIALTCGDVNGVGFEIAAKALFKLQPQIKKSRALVFLFRHIKSESDQRRYLELIDKKFVRLTFKNLSAALEFLNSLHDIKQVPANTLIDLALNSNPAEWVLEASLACQNGLLNSIVTGPLSKTLTVKLKGSPVGHTGIFRQMYPQQPMHMAFAGKDFNVLLASDHIAYSKVEKNLSAPNFKAALKAAIQFKKLLKDKRKVAVLGLNPHAGESGIMGGFEKKMSRYLKAEAFSSFISPDAAFMKNNLNKYCLFLCQYHDQGLIPFKMHHGQDSGVHITMGLPFLRTSVDHGTAYDIYNKDIANPQSMLDAMTLNLKLLGEQDV